MPIPLLVRQMVDIGNEYLQAKAAGDDRRMQHALMAAKINAEAARTEGLREATQQSRELFPDIQRGQQASNKLITAQAAGAETQTDIAKRTFDAGESTRNLTDRRASIQMQILEELAQDSRFIPTAGKIELFKLLQEFSRLEATQAEAGKEARSQQTRTIEENRAAGEDAKFKTRFSQARNANEHIDILVQAEAAQGLLSDAQAQHAMDILDYQQMTPEEVEKVGTVLTNGIVNGLNLQTQQIEELKARITSIQQEAKSRSPSEFRNMLIEVPEAIDPENPNRLSDLGMAMLAGRFGGSQSRNINDRIILEYYQRIQDSQTPEERRRIMNEMTNFMMGARGVAQQPVDVSGIFDRENRYVDESVNAISETISEMMADNMKIPGQDKIAAIGSTISQELARVTTATTDPDRQSMLKARVIMGTLSNPQFINTKNIKEQDRIKILERVVAQDPNIIQMIPKLSEMFPELATSGEAIKLTSDLSKLAQQKSIRTRTLPTVTESRSLIESGITPIYVRGNTIMSLNSVGGKLVETPVQQVKTTDGELAQTPNGKFVISPVGQRGLVVGELETIDIPNALRNKSFQIIERPEQIR